MLEKIEGLPKKSSGVYIVSRVSPRVSGRKKIVKIGMASGSLQDRLDTYHTYYPSSFYIYYVIVTNKAKEMEKKLHTKLKEDLYKHHEYEARREGEWFLVSNKQINKAVEEIVEEMQDDVSKVFFLPYEPDGESTLRREMGRSNKPRMDVIEHDEKKIKNKKRNQKRKKKGR